MWINRFACSLLPAWAMADIRSRSVSLLARSSSTCARKSSRSCQHHQQAALQQSGWENCNMTRKQYQYTQLGCARSRSMKNHASCLTLPALEPNKVPFLSLNIGMPRDTTRKPVRHIVAHYFHFHRCLGNLRHLCRIVTISSSQPICFYSIFIQLLQNSCIVSSKKMQTGQNNAQSNWQLLKLPEYTHL